MNKTGVIQNILDKKGRGRYLEIGVYDGHNFFAIKAKTKVAVDPNFKFSRAQKIKSMRKNRYNILAKYHELTSDEYFARRDNKSQSS